MESQQPPRRVGESVSGEAVSQDTKKFKSMAEQIEYLEGKDTNYVFLFGEPAAGKTAVCASLFLHLSSPQEKLGDMEEFRYEDDTRYQKNDLNLLNTIRDAVRNRRFPARTDVGSLSHVNIRYRPIKRSKPPISVTFLEMAGDDLQKVESTKDSLGNLPTDIDVFFKADRDKVSMLFVLVTSHQNAVKNDKLMVNFLDYIIAQDLRFRDSRILLLISQWDTYVGDKDVKDFIQDRMPFTWSKLGKSTNAYRYFTLGVIKDVDGNPYVAKYDEEPARKVFHWIYHTITGKHLESWWSRISF